jgi:DNA-binding NarL/FixJ family response regulator
MLELHDHVRLTDAEREVLLLVADGRTDEQIASDLVLTRDAVHSRIERFVERTGLHGARRLAAWCARHQDCCIRQPA